MQTTMIAPSLVDSSAELAASVLRFESALQGAGDEAKNRLVEALPSFRSWIVAFDVGALRLKAGPSKYVGYKQMTPELYDSSFLNGNTPLNGLITETKIRIWLRKLKPGEEEFGPAEAVVNDICVRYGKNRNRMSRISSIINHSVKLCGAHQSSAASEFSERVKQSLSDSSSARRRRLENAPKVPERYFVATTSFRRNADVVAETLLQANGICGGCNKAAPFERSADGSPYLEVPHKIPLAAGGEDTIVNAVALCPDCHRREHFGPQRWPWHSL